MKHSFFLLSTLAASAFAFACGSPPEAKIAATQPPPSIATPAPADPLGPRPEVPTPPPFTPPAPTVFTTSNGINVWLLERHALPLVSMELVVPYGSANDPKNQGGVAFATANMMDEGAGSRGAIEFAGAVDLLGASLNTNAGADFSTVSLTVLKRNLEPAMALFSDVVMRPKFDPRDWGRVHDLWTNDLANRASEPTQVLGVVAMATLYPPDHPYAHPVDGTLASAKKVRLADVKHFYEAAWRPDRATLVVVGDATRADIEALLAKTLDVWKAPKNPPIPIAPFAPRTIESAKGSLPVVLVDRADAPQSVIAFVRPSVPAADILEPILSRDNVALGGSFTSRLNQDLREEHGWTYGAKSRLRAMRNDGVEIASASVQTAHTAEALVALLKDTTDFAKGGLTDDEVKKTRLQARSEVIGAFETGSHAVAMLARDAALGLGADYEAKASRERDEATKAELDKAAAEYLNTTQGFIVIVGPRAQIEPSLAAAGLAPTEMRNAEGAITIMKPLPPKSAPTSKPLKK
jgi:zinc protease